MKRVMVFGVLALLSILAAGCGGSHRCSGTELTFRAVPAKGQRVTPAGMHLAQQIMTSRLAKLGVSSPKVAVHGDEIVIQSAGVLDPARTAAILAETGRLQLFDFEPSLAPPAVQGNQQPAALPSLYSLLSAVKKEASQGRPQSYYLFKTTPSHPVIQGPASNLHELLRPYAGGKQPADTEVLKVPANREPVHCKVSTGCPGAGHTGGSKSGWYWYLFKVPPALTGKDLVESGTAADVDPNTGQPIVTLQFTGHGSQEFKRITQAEYNRGRVNAGEAGRLNAQGDQAIINQYAGHNAIVFDGQLEEAPYIDYTDPALSQGIVGNAQITEPNSFQASRTALVLQSGSLPYSFQQVGRANCPR
jgi:preprotein translocase subunit SecD